MGPKMSKRMFSIMCYVKTWNINISVPQIISFRDSTKNISVLLYSWRFSRCSAPIHWLIHGHTTSNNEIVYHQMQWVGNSAKTDIKWETAVTREMLTAAARDQSVQLPFVLLYNRNDFRRTKFTVPQFKRPVIRS